MWPEVYPSRGDSTRIQRLLEAKRLQRIDLAHRPAHFGARSRFGGIECAIALQVSPRSGAGDVEPLRPGPLSRI
jgi:hypothetical protein